MPLFCTKNTNDKSAFQHRSQGSDQDKRKTLNEPNGYNAKKTSDPKPQMIANAIAEISNVFADEDDIFSSIRTAGAGLHSQTSANHKWIHLRRPHSGQATQWSAESKRLMRASDCDVGLPSVSLWLANEHSATIAGKRTTSLQRGL